VYVSIRELLADRVEAQRRGLDQIVALIDRRLVLRGFTPVEAAAWAPVHTTARTRPTIRRSRDGV
jgi:hypothetical protein